MFKQKEKQAKPYPCIAKANWNKFREQVDKGLNKKKFTRLSKLTSVVNRFNRILQKAAKKAIPLVKPRKKAKAWWCGEAEEAVQNRREHQRNRNRNRDPAAVVELREAYNKASQEAKTVINKAKAQSMEKFCNKLDTSTDPRILYNTVREYCGKEKKAPPQVPLKNGTRTAKTTKEKAEMLAKQYGAVSKSIFHSQTRDTRAALKKRRLEVDKATEEPCKRHPNCKRKMCHPFTMTELEAALANMNGKAPGPDGITPRMLKELSGPGKKTLLRIANLSFRKKEIPTIWRRAIITAVPKPGKPEEKPSSYRPISLTSCVGKTVERMIQGRLQYMVEKLDVLTPEQAGFRANRCTEEQVARVGQDIMDALEQPKMERTVLAAVDMTAAYDRVHRDSLLLKMLDMGVPPCYVKWFKHFLADRRGRVKWEDTLSNEFIIREGLPQGTVTSPTLWLCYINDLCPMLKRHGVEVALYADDLVIYTSHRNPGEAAIKVQAALDELDEWADTWSMQVSQSKTKTILYSTHKDETNGKMQLNLCMGDQVLEQTTEIKLLGVTLDTQLTFRSQVMDTKKKLDKRISAMKLLAGTSWGCRETTLKKVYEQFVQPVGLYGSSTWIQFARPTNRDIIDRSSRAAARVICGYPLSSSDGRGEHQKPDITGRRAGGNPVRETPAPRPEKPVSKHGKKTDRTQTEEQANLAGTGAGDGTRSRSRGPPERGVHSPMSPTLGINKVRAGDIPHTISCPD